MHKLSTRQRFSGMVCGAFCCSWSRPISIGRLASIWVLLPCLLLPACNHAQLHLNSISSAFLLTRLIQNMRTLASCVYKLLMHKKSKESPNRNASVAKTLRPSRPAIKVVNSLEITWKCNLFGDESDERKRLCLHSEAFLEVIFVWILYFLFDMKPYRCSRPNDAAGL